MADYTVTPANVLASALALRLAVGLAPSGLYGTKLPVYYAQPTAGADIEAGQPVYQAADTFFYLADANGADPLYKVAGVTENRARAGQPLSIVYFDPAFQPGFTLAIGDTLILSATVGRICPDADKATGWFVSTLGVGISTTKMALNITRSDAARL
jgi:hypothetical protein